MATNDDYLRDRLKALTGGTPPSNILGRSGLWKFEQDFRARHEKREKQGKAAAERIAKARAPVIEAFGRDEACVGALKEFRHYIQSWKPPKKLPPKLPSARDDVRSGSILTVVGPPYNVLVGWAEGPTQPYQSATEDGFFEVDAIGGGGYAAAVAGVGTWFSPIKDCVIRAASYTPYNWGYSEYANFVTAHCDGYFGWWIWNATEQTETYQSFNQIFSRGVSWLDEADDSGSSFFEEQPLVLVRGGEWYEIVTYCEVMVDDGFGSSAGAGINGHCGFFVFEQFL